MPTRSPTRARKVPARKEINASTFSGHVAARARSLRDKRRMSVEEVVEAINEAGYSIKVERYRQWERHHSKIDPDSYPFLAAAFGIKVETFLGGFNP